MEIVFLVCLFVVAALYASVGHGGASGYLALMALFGIAPEFMRSTSLTLNLFVSFTAFYAYHKAGHFRFKLLLPFALASVPMAYIGAQLHIEPRIYKLILGLALVIAIGRILYTPAEIESKKNIPFLAAFAIGGVLGLLSGAIGIGGGIILSPLLLLLHWANMKETAAVSAMFIFVNSVSGLAGLWQAGTAFTPDIFVWASVGFTGGILGAYSGGFKLNLVSLKYLLSVVLLIASLKLIFV